MLTPQEVSTHVFSKARMGGYNMAMVDEFLDTLTEDYTTLYKENAALKAKLKVLVDKVEEYRATEDSMRATLLTAQKMASQMAQEAEKEKADLLAAARIVDAEVDDPLRLPADPVIYHEWDPHVIAERLVVLRAEADHNDPLHVPHGGKAEDLPGVLRFFHHHEPAGLFDLRGKLVQRFGDKKIAQRAPLILFVVVDKHADDPRVVLCQEDPRHVGDILPLLQQRRHALDRRVRDLLRLPVDHVRYRRRAEPQLLRQITDPHPLFLHSPLPFPQNPSPPFYPPSPTKSKVIRGTP